MTIHRLGKTENGQPLSIRVGDTVIVALPENPTTGYRWTVTTDGNILALKGEPGFERAGDGVGAGGMRIFSFATAHAGPCSLTGWLARPRGDLTAVAPDYMVHIVSIA